MLLFGGRALRHRTIGLGGRARRRRRGLEPAGIAAGGKREGRAQQNGRSPKLAAHSVLAPSRTVHHVATLATYVSREPDHDPIGLNRTVISSLWFEHDLRANASRLSRGN